MTKGLNERHAGFQDGIAYQKIQHAKELEEICAHLTEKDLKIAELEEDVRQWQDRAVNNCNVAGERGRRIAELERQEDGRIKANQSIRQMYIEKCSKLETEIKAVKEQLEEAHGLMAPYADTANWGQSKGSKFTQFFLEEECDVEDRELLGGKSLRAYLKKHGLAEAREKR